MNIEFETLAEADVLLAALEAQCRKYERSIKMRGTKEMREHLRRELKKVEDTYTEVEVARTNWLHDAADAEYEASPDYFNRYIAGDR